MLSTNHGMPFIVTTTARQSVETQRKFIRGHVMRGKNRNKLLLKLPLDTGSDLVCETDSRQNEHVLAIPAKVGSEFSFTVCSTDMDSDTLQTIWKCKPRSVSYCRIV